MAQPCHLPELRLTDSGRLIDGDVTEAQLFTRGYRSRAANFQLVRVLQVAGSEDERQHTRNRVAGLVSQLNKRRGSKSQRGNIFNCCLEFRFPIPHRSRVGEGQQIPHSGGRQRERDTLTLEPLHQAWQLGVQA